MKAEQLLRWGTACPGDFELLRKCLDATDTRWVVMIGSGLGVLSAVVMEYSKASLFSIDIDPNNKERENLKSVGLHDSLRLEQFVGESSHVGRHAYTLELVDIIVVDGGHDYEQVKADIEAWTQHLRPGGILFFHDYKATDAPMQHPGVGQAVDESEVATWPVFGRQGWSIAFQKPEAT